MENTETDNIKKSGRGGFRPGSGRKKGGRNVHRLNWYQVGLYPEEWKAAQERTGLESPAKAAAKVIRIALDISDSFTTDA